MNAKEKFIWKCGYSHIRPDEKCECQSKREYGTKEEAARAGLQHKPHPNSVGVYSTKTGYIGLAVGLNFNAGKIIPGK